MLLTATKFRQELFATLESVRAGETVEIRYKGTLLQLAPVKNSSKLARLQPKPVFAPGARNWKTDLRQEMKRVLADGRKSS